MDKKKEFVSEVTEFPIDCPEVEQPGRFGFGGLYKLFSFSRSSGADTTKNESGVQESYPKDEKKEEAVTFHSPGDDSRSLPNVLKRISNLIAMKEGTTSEKNLKRYWLPDSFSNECYECGEKFTAFRRRHHCRVCGQIFCSRCCFQKIPGKVMQCAGDLRVCTYCCKVVLSYLESGNMNAELTADLRSLQEDLHVKLGSHMGNVSGVRNSNDGASEVSTSKRKISLGYQEERFVLGRAPSCSVLSDEERCQALQKSTSLRGLFEEILDTVSGVPLSTFQYKNRDISDCLRGGNLIDWLIANSKAANRVQALALGQMLLEAGYFEAVTDPCFTDGDSRYRVIPNLLSPPPVSSPWGATTDSECERVSEGDEEGSLRQSTSSYQLEIDLEERVVHLARPSPPTDSGKATNNAPRKKISIAHEADSEGSVFLDAPPNPDLTVTRTGWHQVDHLVRTDNEEADVYFALSSAFETHESDLVNQLLRSSGLCQSWAKIVIPIAQSIVDQIHMDHGIDNEMDIRSFVQIKRLPGGTKEGIRVIPGVVCSKNVVHRGMRTRIDNARIMILKCAVVYQRVEGRISSLEPVMMQEPEYLRHVVARIESLKPDVVLVNKNVSLLAQEYLLDLGITLVINVKLSVLERVSRLTGADIIKNVDAHVGKPQLGTCSSFFLESFFLDDGSKKTLMFFEGNPEISCTVLLRGGTLDELTSLKKISSFILLSEYNWRLEKSFLMDELARPPSPPRQLFQDSPTCSLAEKLEENFFTPDSGKRQTHFSISSFESFDALPCDPSPHHEVEKVKEENVTSEKMEDKNLDTNNCRSDPLQSEVFYSIQSKWENSPEIRLSVAELPRKNKFRTALDDTIISISPFLKLNVPYLESESGKNCTLRSFFPENLFNSKQFKEQCNEREPKILPEREKPQPSFEQTLKDEFLTAKFTDDVSSEHIQTLLALFRANGGRIAAERKVVTVKKTANVKPEMRDVLDPFEHQRFSVLFCTYSNHSENAPAFCVDPWVVTMTSYGPNDVPLGWFLEYYCFGSAARCPSQTCHLPPSQHMRRFVHDAGALCLTVNSLAKKLDSEQIWMWNWCTICKVASQRLSMTSDTWSLSFAKYLELRFLGDAYTRRGSDGCSHSLHHQHIQFFAQSGRVAAFQFIPIPVKWEISLPPFVITIIKPSTEHASVVDELRALAIKGHDVFSSILGILMGIETLPDDEIQALKQQQQKEQAYFKIKIEELQVRLTSPTLEAKRFEPGTAAKEAEVMLWRVEDSIVSLKRYICEIVASWNVRFVDSKRKEDRRKRVSDGNVKTAVSPNQSEDNASKEDDEINSTEDLEEEQVWDKCGDSSTDVAESEDNMSLASYQDDAMVRDDTKERRAEQREEHSADHKIDKKSVKTIFSQILTTNKDTSFLQNPWSPLEHYLLPLGLCANIVVIESEVSSIIAYTLASQDYKRRMEEKKSGILNPPQSEANAPSPLYRRKTLNSSSSADKEADAAVSPNHCDVSFSDSSASFSCRVYYGEDFANFRSLVFPSGEEAYIRSLSRCAPWAAKGGKSGSSFSKTKDDRFVIKQLPKIELDLFLDFAPQYLSYVSKCLEKKEPTLLGKIFGVYTVTCRKSTAHLLVMENLFYQRAVTDKYDLKGSVRNRFANTIGQRDSEVVYMDENLLKITRDSPLYVMYHSQSVLMRAIGSDTEFLAGQHVMDYSLLVGLDNNRSELVVGIIDYIRTFTWDKKLENMVKTSVMGHTGKQPTIIEPKDYRVRFIAAMERYFLPVPDRWFGFNNTGT